MKKLSESIVHNRLGQYNLKIIGSYLGCNVKHSILCLCGRTYQAKLNHIFSGKSRSCGCFNKLSASERKLEDLTDQKINMLYVISRAPNKNSRVRWNCLCDCGNFKTVGAIHLLDKTLLSCGCLLKQRGPNHPNFNPSLTDEQRLPRNTKELKDWRKAVYIKDDFTCQICKVRGCKLNAHHLNGWNWCINQRYDINNGVSLCINCHKKFHKQYGNRNNTIEQFNMFRGCSQIDST